MDYKKMVEIVKTVTGVNVPVYFDDNEANNRGSAYFGICGNEFYVCDEGDLDNPMFEFEDFVENKHLGLYHIGLPTQIFMYRDEENIFTVIGEQFQAHGIDVALNKEMMELFITLHEFGHAHQVFCQYEGNIERYIAENHQNNSYMRYQIKTRGLFGTEEGFRLHKSLPTEQYADNFALTHFNDVLLKYSTGL